MGSSSAPKAPPPPSPPPTEISADVQQAQADERKRLLRGTNMMSTILTQRTNMGGTLLKDKLGQ